MITLVNKTEGKHVTMIGLSIDGEIPSTNEFAIKLMPPHGKMYITEVTGIKNNSYPKKWIYKTPQYNETF